MTRFILAAALCLGLAACSSMAPYMNGTNFEPEHDVDREHVKSEYGDTPTVPVTVPINGQPYGFTVRVSANHPRILVAASQEAEDATAGTASRYTLGLVARSREIAPYQEAALQHLAAIGRKDCRIRSSAQFNKIGFEFNYECAIVVPPKKQ